jgi:hypothetical protein
MDSNSERGLTGTSRMNLGGLDDPWQYTRFRLVVEMHVCFWGDPNSNGVLRLRSAGASLRSG